MALVDDETTRYTRNRHLCFEQNQKGHFWSNLFSWFEGKPQGHQPTCTEKTGSTIRRLSGAALSAGFEGGDAAAPKAVDHGHVLAARAVGVGGWGGGGRCSGEGGRLIEWGGPGVGGGGGAGGGGG